MIKYKTRKNYRKLYLNMKGYLLVCITIIIFVSAMFGWAIKGNMALREELLMNQNVGVIIR